MNTLNYWICELAFLASGFIYVHTIESRQDNRRKLIAAAAVFLICCAALNHFPIAEVPWLEMLVRVLGFLFLIQFQHIGRNLTWYAAVYYAIWNFMSWQLLYEAWLICELAGKDFLNQQAWAGWIREILVFAGGYLLIALTIGRFIPEKGRKKIGPRQLGLAIVTFLVFEILVLPSGALEGRLQNQGWITLYLTQLLLGVVLYLQNETFKKSEMRQEVDIINLLLKKEQEQYQLSRENIELINQKVHDLKHQIRAIRNASKEDIEKYLDEIEESVQVYDAIVKTGNEVLDTILTEKSLYCRERGITVSCVADGSQMDFINTVDLYAILGNAIDNAIEAVEKFSHKEKRQIDVIIYRQQQFLAVNIVNPVKGNLVYEDELPVTTKEDKRFHGFGLLSMKYILKRYDGFLRISEEDGCFSLMMLIPIPSSTCDV